MSKESQERSDMRHIRFFKGSVKDFKQMFDDLAGQNTNAYDTPEYQGFNDVHPVRGDNKSKHWESSNIESELNEAAPKMKSSPFTEKVRTQMQILSGIEAQMKYEDKNGWDRCKNDFKKAKKAMTDLSDAIRRHGKNY